MAKDAYYRVTRAGRDVFVGDANGLVNAADEGAIRENDLVFDPETDAWVFARSHELLEGKDLSALNKVFTGAPEGGVEPGVEGELRSSRRRRSVLAVLVSTLLVGLATWVAFMGGDVRLMQFLEDRPEAPTVIKAPAGGGGGEETGGIRPSMPQPEDLVFDPTAAGGDPGGGFGGVFMEPTEAERRAYGGHAMRGAREILDNPAPAVGDERLTQLLGALARAEFAKVSMQHLSDKEGIAAAKAVADEVRESFMAACRIDNSKRFCELKMKNPGWPDPVLRQVEVEKVVVGMTADHVYAAWGRPTGLRRSGGAQVYCYGQFCGRSVRLINRTVVAVDDD